MSWHFSFSARGHAEAKRKLAQHKEQFSHAPAPVFAAAEALIETFPDTPDRAIIVTSHGHVDATTASSAMITVDFAAGVDAAAEAGETATGNADSDEPAAAGNDSEGAAG
jgi:hypothetical protein